jgi:hypothetical protein
MELQFISITSGFDLYRCRLCRSRLYLLRQL